MRRQRGPWDFDKILKDFNEFQGIFGMFLAMDCF